MEFIPQSIPDVVLIKPHVYEDDRGYFMETWRENIFSEKISKDVKFVQENQSKSVKGTIRGLHYQLEKPQGKLVRVVTGEVYDVAVDLRVNSPFFGKWVGVYLSSDNKEQLWVPPGFAHGFYVVSEIAEFFYKCTNYYSPKNERILHWKDPTIAVQWPILAGVETLISVKDSQGGLFKDLEMFG